GLKTTASPPWWVRGARPSSCCRSPSRPSTASSSRRASDEAPARHPGPARPRLGAGPYAHGCLVVIGVALAGALDADPDARGRGALCDRLPAAAGTLVAGPFAASPPRPALRLRHGGSGRGHPDPAAYPRRPVLHRPHGRARADHVGRGSAAGLVAAARGLHLGLSGSGAPGARHGVAQPR